MIVNFLLAALQITNVIISLTIFSAYLRYIPNTVSALLGCLSFTTTTKSDLNFFAIKFTLADVVFSIPTTDWLIGKLAFAGGFTSPTGLKASFIAQHHAAVFIGNSVRGTHPFLRESARASTVWNWSVVEVETRTDLSCRFPIAFCTAQIGIGDSLEAADRIVSVIARAQALCWGSKS